MWISLSFNFMAMILQELLVLTQPILLNEKNLKYILLLCLVSRSSASRGLLCRVSSQVSPKAAAPVQQLEILSRFQDQPQAKRKRGRWKQCKKTWSKKRKGTMVAVQKTWATKKEQKEVDCSSAKKTWSKKRKG